jgi:hypothetical protein
LISDSRGYDRREYRPFGVSFEDYQAIFEEGMEVVRRLWSADGPISHHGQHYHFDDVAITPRPMHNPNGCYRHIRPAKDYVTLTVNCAGSLPLSLFRIRLFPLDRNMPQSGIRLDR